jgi:hypothetical protein
MSLGARANAEHIDTVADDRLGVQLEPVRSTYAGGMLSSIDYRSLSQEVAGFTWHWDARAAGDLGYGRTRSETERYERLNGRRSDASVSVGHAFDRSMNLPWIATVNTTFVQEVGFSHYSEDEAFKPIVTHSASFSKGFADEMGSSYFRLYLRDTHSFGDKAEEFQTAQVDYTRRLPLSSNQSINGSLGAQAVRQTLYAKGDLYVFTRADLEYEYRDIFGIYNLNFLSNVRINALGQTDLARDWKDDLSPDLFRNDWRNRFLYPIGKLQLSLEGTLFQVDGKLGHYARVGGRRSFDFVD